MDIHMPVMNGIEAVAAIRMHEASLGRARQLIIGMSANASGSTAMDLKAVGFDGFTTKPFTYDELFTLYQVVLAEQQYHNYDGAGI